MRIAVVGSGMAGLTAARLIQDSGHQVTIYEKAAKRGMDAHAVEIDDKSGTALLDVPLRVMSTRGWRTVLSLCDQYGVETFQVTTPVALSWLNQKTWFRTGNINLGSRHLPTLGSWKYVGKPAYIFLREFLRLRRDLEKNVQGKTLEEFFKSYGYEEIFWRGLVVPLILTIATCRIEHLLKYPAEGLLTLVDEITFGAPLRRLKGGTRALVDKLAQGIDLVNATSVANVSLIPGGVRVQGVGHHAADYDALVIATQANQLEFLGEEFRQEKELLNRFVFDQGELYVHRDERVMPKDRRDWTPLSYLMDEKFSSTMFSVWVNPVEPALKAASPVFQTWNPTISLDDKKILKRIPLERAVVTQSTLAAQQKLNQLMEEKDRRVFFCGSWSYPGVPLLESAARSAIRVAQRFGSEVSFQ